MTIPALPTPIDDDELALASRCIVHFRASDLSINALSGQLGTYASSATTPAITDAEGMSVTGGILQPRFAPYEWDGDVGRGSMCLYMDTTDRLSWGCEWRPRALAFYLRFVEQGARVLAAGTALMSITADTVTGARLILDTSGTGAGHYRITHHNGTTGVTATLAGVQPASGDRVVLRGYLYADGSVQLWQSVNAAAEEFTARTAANALAASWVTGARVRLNSAGTTNIGVAAYRQFKLAPALPEITRLARML